MTERQMKIRKLRAQSDKYAERLDRERSTAARPAGKKPYADTIAKDPIGERAVRRVGGAH